MVVVVVLVVVVIVAVVVVVVVVVAVVVVVVVVVRPVGPGPRAANFQGRHINKIEIEVWYAEKKGCPRERNLREIYTENNVGTEFSRYDAIGARRS